MTEEHGKERKVLGKSMGRKGRFEGGLWEGKYCLKEEYGKERKAYRKSMGKKGRFKGKVWERK